MRTNSLAFRLFATAAAWVLLVLPVAGMIIYSLYREEVENSYDRRIGVLLTDHNVREVLRIADRIYLIVGGKVVTSGTPQELVRDPIAIDAYLGRSFEDDGLPGGGFPGGGGSGLACTIDGS